MNDTVSYGLSKRELLVFFYKYRLRLLRAFAIPFLISIAISFVPTPRYKADSVLIVRLGAEYVYQPEMVNKGGAPASVIPFERDQIFKSEVAILDSKDLHEQVIKKIGIQNLYPDLLKTTGVFASLSKSITDALIADGIMNQEEESPQNAERMLLGKAVEKFEKRFGISLEKESAVINLSFEHKDHVLATKVLNTLLGLYFEKRKQLYLEPRAELAKAEVQSKQERVLAAGRAFEKFKRSRNIYSFEDQRLDLLERRNAAQEQAFAISNPRLDEKIAEYDAKLKQLDAQEQEFNRLQKEAEIAETSYTLYSNKLDEAKTFENIQRQQADSVRVIQPPLVPAEPKRLQLLIILGGFFVSIVWTLMVAAYTEFSRSGFLSPEQIERHLGIPVMAVIPFQQYG